MDLPDLPNWHALGVMLLTVAALFLFTRERIPIETTSILVLAMLAVSFTVFPFEADGEKLEPEEFFLGFGNEALIAISALMMASYGLVRTGALAPIGRWTAALWNMSPNGAMLGMLVDHGDHQRVHEQHAAGRDDDPDPDQRRDARRAPRLRKR